MSLRIFLTCLSPFYDNPLDFEKYGRKKDVKSIGKNMENSDVVLKFYSLENRFISRGSFINEKYVTLCIFKSVYY